MAQLVEQRTRNKEVWSLILNLVNVVNLYSAEFLKIYWLL